ncbi:MAG TPA: OmpA family protein [Candidatus Kapabacteria bacterium]|nr:OmpA family protein [Candidatus Kapabacteria bacterium]
MRKFILILFLILISLEVFSQAPSGELTYQKWTSTNDTLVVKRRNGNWWFGAQIGLNRNYYFGTLSYTTNNDPGNPFKRLVKFDIGDGGGALFGGMLEYLPVGETWGYGLQFNILEGREINASSTPMQDSLLTYYDFKSSLNYIVFSPYARLNFFFPGLFAYSGLNIALNTSQNTNFLKKFQNSGSIQQWQKQDLTDLPISIGFHVGFGYDIFLADINEQARTRLTPFVSLNLNSSMIGDNNSTWSGLQLKMGFAVKLGFDNILYDTLFYDKNYVPPPAYIASISNGKGVEFDGFRSYKEFISADLKTVEIPLILTEAKKDTNINLASSSIGAQIEPSKFNIGNPYKFSFASSVTTELSNDLRTEIKKMSQFLKNNPRVRVSIVGYSDNAGTFAQNDSRSRERAQKAYQEFIKNGVKPSQISAPAWRGSIAPIADNSSEDGRRRNRRVEIIFTR